MNRTDPRWSLLDVVESLGAAVYGEPNEDAQLAAIPIGPDGAADAGVTIDTRAVRPGDVFVALQGTRSHGIEHARAAFEAGAAAVLAGTDLEVADDRWDELLAEAVQHGPVLVATDCDGVTALGRLARAWRRRGSWRVVGITGSSGKTSTKDLLGAMLRRAGWRTVASHANWNNEIGVPLTLLAAGAQTDVVICEMGMRGLGQIAWLCDVADPDVGIVTTAGTAHLELLGSVEAIVQAKAEILAGTWRGGVGIFPGIQPQLVEAAGEVPDRLLPFGVGEDEAEDSAILVTELARGDRGIRGTIDLLGRELAFDVPLHGVHHARNLAAAAAALVTLTGSAQLLDEHALQLQDSGDFLTTGRGTRHALDGSGVVIDDAYNANPESMRATLDELAATGDTTRRVAVLGRMAELGESSPNLHALVGMHAGGLATIDELVVVGSGVDALGLVEGWRRARGTAPRTYDDVDVAIAALAEWYRPGDAVVVKASNSSGLGRLATALVERFGMDPAPQGGDDT